MSPGMTRISGRDGTSVELPSSMRDAPELAVGDVHLAALADPWPWPEWFRPRFLVQVSALAPDRATVPQLAAHLIAEQIARGAHVATSDLWPVPTGEDGRRVISLVPLANDTLVRLQYVSTRGGRAVLVTAEHSAANYTLGATIFRAAVGSIEVAFDDALPEPDPSTLPPLDPFASAEGEAFEDLSGVRAAQPYRSRGPGLSEEQIDAVRRGKLRRVERAALEAGALVDGRGRLTEGGERARRALDAPSRRVTAEVVDDADGAVARMELLQRAKGTAVLAGPPPGSPAGARTLDAIASRTSPIFLARWLGLAPAWTIALAAEGQWTLPLDPAVLDARARSADVPPPPDAARGLRWMWEQPWQLATLASDTPARRLRVIATPRAGYFRLERDAAGGEASLSPLPAEYYLRELLWFGGFDLSQT